MSGIEQAVSSPTAAARVEEILRAACRVVATGNASDLRIGTVAQEAGVSRTLVHYYFTTRQELSALRSRTRKTYVSTRSRPSWRRSLPAPSALSEPSSARSTPRSRKRPRSWNEVWSSLRNDEELRPLVQERYRAWIERVVRLLEEGREDGSVPRSVDPAGAGWRLAAAADGLDSILYVGLLIVMSPVCCSPRVSSGSSSGEGLRVRRPRARRQDLRPRRRGRRRLARSGCGEFFSLLGPSWAAAARQRRCACRVRAAVNP